MFKCQTCNFETESKAKFAGHRSGHVRRGDVLKHIRLKKNEWECKICNKIFKTSMSYGGHKAHSHKLKIEDYKKDDGRREFLIREIGRKCQVCKNDLWMGEKIPIELDHIDGNPENNVRENLRLICPNCHAQTDTYKGRNIGKVSNSKRSQVLKQNYGKYR